MIEAECSSVPFEMSGNMSNRQVRRQASTSASKVPAKRARYGDASTSHSSTAHEQLTMSPQSSGRPFPDGGGNHIGSAHKETGSYSRDEKDVQMPVVKIPRADLSLLKLEKTSAATRSSSARSERPSRKDSLVKRGESPSVGSSSTKIPSEGNAGSSGRGKSKPQTPSGQVILPSKRPLDLALGLGKLDASKASPFSLTAQFHKVMESISNSDSQMSMRRKKLSARKSTSSCSNVSFKAFREIGRDRGDLDNSSSLSSPPRQVVAVDEEVSFSLPAKMTNEKDSQQSTVSDPNKSGSSSPHLEVVKSKEGKIYQMAARKAYPYQINSRNERTSGKQKEVKAKSPFTAARKSAPYSQAAVNQRYLKTQGDRRESTSAVQEISSRNVERPTAARKSYPAAIKRVKISRDSIPSDVESQRQPTAARKSYPAVIKGVKSSQDSIRRESQNTSTAARKSYPVAIKTGRGSRDSVSSDAGSQERPTAARKSYPAAIKTVRGSRDSVSSDVGSQERPTAARKSYPAAIKTGRGSRDSVSSDAGSQERPTAARKSYPAAIKTGKSFRGSVQSEGESQIWPTAARKSYPVAVNTRRGPRDSVPSDVKSHERQTAARKSYPVAVKAGRHSRDSLSSGIQSQKRSSAARKSYPIASKSERGSHREHVPSEMGSPKGPTAARKSYPHSTLASRDHSAFLSSALDSSVTWGKIERKSASDRYFSIKEHRRGVHSKETPQSPERTNVSEATATSNLTARKTDPYRMTMLGKQSETTQVTAKSPTTLHLKARRSDPYGMSLVRKKSGVDQKTASNTDDVAPAKQLNLIGPKTAGKSPSIATVSGKKSESYRMDIGSKESGVISSKTAIQSPLSSRVTAGKIDPCQQTTKDGGRDILVQKAARKAVPGSYRTMGKAASYNISDRGKAARKSAPYQQTQVSLNRKMHKTHKAVRKSSSRQEAQERSLGLYGVKGRTGQCSVALVDAARDVAASVGTHLWSEGTTSGSESTRDGEAKKESKESEKVVLHQKYDGMSGQKEDLTKPVSCSDNAEVNSRKSRRRRGEKTRYSPSFDFEEKTEEGRGKFHIVTLGHSPVSGASPVAIPRSKYARQSLQSSSTPSRYHRREGVQSKHTSAQKEEKISGAEQQGSSSPTFSRYVSYESKPSVGCKINEGWKVLSIGKVTRKEISPKKKGSIHRTGRNKNQEVDSDESSEVVDLTSSLEEDDDDDDDGDDVASNKETSSNSDIISSKDEKSEATEPSCQDRNIFDMFKIPMSNNTTSTFPPLSLEKKSNLADNIIETEQQTPAESSEQSTASSEMISVEEDTLISDSSLVEKEESETAEQIKDPVQGEENRESDSSDWKNIEKLKEISEPDKNLSSSLQMESVVEGALTADTDDADVSKGTSSFKDVKEPTDKSEDINSERSSPGRRSKGQKGDIAKVSTSEELSDIRGYVTRDSEVVYTSLRRMTRSERERIKAVEKDLENKEVKEVEVVVRKIPTRIGNETQLLETEKKEETSSLQEGCVEHEEKTCIPPIKDDKGEIAAMEDGDDRNISEPSKTDRVKDDKKKSLEKSLGISEEIPGAKQLQEETREVLAGTDEDDSDALGEAIADFLDDKDIDRIELNISSDVVSESDEEKEDNREEATSIVQSEQNTPMVLGSGKEESTNMQDEDVSTTLEEETTVDNIGEESKKGEEINEPSLDPKIVDSIGKESKKDGQIKEPSLDSKTEDNIGKESKIDGEKNEPSLDPLPEKEDEEDEEEDDSRNIFAIFQKAEKEEMLSPSKEKKRSRISVEDSEKNTKSSNGDDLVGQKKTIGTGQGKLHGEVMEEGSAETNTEKTNIFQMLEKHGGDRNVGMVKTPVLKVLEELANDAEEKTDGDSSLATSTSMSGKAISEGETFDDGATKEMILEADKPSCRTLFESPEEESCPQSIQDPSSEQEKRSDVEPTLASVSKEPAPLIPSDNAPEHGSQSDLNVEQNVDGDSVMEALPQSQTSEVSDKEDKGENNLDDMSGEKIEITGEKSALDITMGGLKESNLTNMAAAEGMKVGEDGVDESAPQNEDGVNKPEEGDHCESKKMSVSEGQPPLLQPFNADEEGGSKSAESSEESTCMPIIVSVSSVTSADSFLNPSPLKLSQAEDTILPEEGSITTLGSFGNDQGLDGFVEDSSAKDGGESLLPSQKDDMDTVQSELHDTSLDADEDPVTSEPASASSNADSYNAGDVDIIDGISFMSFSTKEEILSFMNMRKANKKGKTKKKVSAMTAVWATSKKKKKPAAKKTPPKPLQSIFPVRPKDHSQKCIEDYQEKFLKDLRKQKRNEILHPALLKRGVSIKRSLDCGIPLLIDLELLDVRLDEEIPRPKKDNNQSQICNIPKEPAASPVAEKDNIVTTEDCSDNKDMTEEVTRTDEEVTLPSTVGESQEQNENIEEEAPKEVTDLEPARKEHRSTAQKEVLAREHAVFKPFEKPVLSQKSAFCSSELDTYLNKLEEEKKEQLTPKSPKNKPKKPVRSRHMDKLSSAIQEISFSSLFKGKQKDSEVSGKTKDVDNKSASALQQSKAWKNVKTPKEPNTFLAPSINKTRIGTTILKKSTAGSTRFRGPLPTVKDSPKKSNKGVTDLPPNTSIIFLRDDGPMQPPRRNRQSRFLDRLVLNVKRATEAEKKMSPGFNQGAQSQGQKTPEADMSTIPQLSGRTNDPTLGVAISPNDVLPVKDSSSPSVNPALSMVDKSQQNIPSTSKQRLPAEKNLLEYFKEDPQPCEYGDLPGVTTPCGNDFCRLGCVCSSLQTKFDEIPPEHCRKLECMLECKCERFPSLRILRARKRPAIFHQDGMVFYDEAGLLSEADDRKRRRLDPSVPVEKSDSVSDKSTTKKAVKASSNSAPLKQSGQKIEETEKATTPKLVVKPQRKEPGFARGRVYIAKHIRHAAKQEEQDQNDPGGVDGATKNVVPPVKVVRTVDGYCVKPATNVNQSRDTDAKDEAEEGFKLLKRVDRMLYLSQRYKQKSQSHTRGHPKDPEQEKNEKTASQASQADNPSPAGDVSGASAKSGVGSSGTEASGSQNSNHTRLEATTKKSAVGMDKEQGRMAPTIDNQVNGNDPKDEDKEADMMRSKPNSEKQSVGQENSFIQGVIGHRFIRPLVQAKSLVKVPVPPPKPCSDGQTLQFHQYKPTDVEILPDSGSENTQPLASSETLHTSVSSQGQAQGLYLANSKSRQGLTAGSSAQSSPPQLVNTAAGKSGSKTLPPGSSETLHTSASEGKASVSTSQVQDPNLANPKFRQGLTSHASLKSAPPQRVTVTGGKIVQQQPHGLLLQQGRGGGQFISLPVQPPILHQSKQLAAVLGQSSVQSRQQQSLQAQHGGPSKNKLIVLPPKKPEGQTGPVSYPPLLRLPQKVVDGRLEKQLILIPQGKSLGNAVPAVINKDNTNYQAFWVQTSAGKAPMLLVPVQPKVSEQPTQSGFLLMPSSEGTLSVAEQLKLKREKEKQKELEDCYGLKAYNCSQRGVIRPLCELAGYMTAQRRNGMDPTPFLKKQSLFIPNSHLMNPNKAFHLLVDVYSNCQWEQDRQSLFNVIFKMASKVRATESLTVNGYRVVRTSFIKHSQKAKSINVSSSVARNCTTKIRIIGLFQSEFKITRVGSVGNVMNPKTKTEVPGHDETSQFTPSVERRNLGNQSRENVPTKQDGVVGGGEKGTKERSAKKDGQGLRKKVNILRTARNVEQKEQAVARGALGAGFPGVPKAMIKGRGGGVVNIEKKPFGDKDSRELLTGTEVQKMLPKMPRGIVPGCSDQSAPARKQEVFCLNSPEQDSTHGVDAPADDKQECKQQTREKMIGQGKETLEQPNEEMAGKGTEVGIEERNKDVLEQPNEEMAAKGTEVGIEEGKKDVLEQPDEEGDKHSNKRSEERSVEGGDEGTVEHVSEQSDREGTAKLVVGAHDQLSEVVSTNMDSVTLDGIGGGKNLKLDKIEGEKNEKPDKMEDEKNVKSDEVEEGNREMAEMNFSSHQKAVERTESGEDDKDMDVHNTERILDGKVEEKTGSGINLDEKLPKGSDEMMEEAAKSELALSGSSGSFNLPTKETTKSQDRKSDDEDKSEDGNEMESLRPSQEMTGVHDQPEAKEMSSERQSGQNESSSLLEKQSEEVVKNDVARASNVDDKGLDPSQGELRLVSGGKGTAETETEDNKHGDVDGESKKETNPKDQNDDCILLDDGEKKLEDGKNNQEDGADSQEENKNVPSEGQGTDDARSLQNLHNLVANLSNRVSDVVDEESKVAEKLQGGSDNIQEEDTVSSSSEDEVTSSDSDSGSDSESADEETDQTPKRREWFNGARSCTIRLSSIIEKCFSGSVPFTAKWPEKYLDKRGWAEGMPRSKKMYETSFLDGCVSGKELAWPLKPKKKEVKFMSPDSLSDLYKKREEQKHEEKRQRARRLAHDRRQSFKSLPPSQRLPKRDKVKSLEYCVVDKKEPEVSDEELDVLGFDDDDECYTTDDDSIYTDSSYEDEQRSKNEALFSLAVIPSFAGRFKALLEKRGAIATPPSQDTSPKSGESPADRSEMQSPLVPEVRNELFLKDTDFGSSGDESDSSLDVEKWSDSDSQRMDLLKDGTDKKSSNSLQGVDHACTSPASQSLTSSPSRSKKRKADVKEKRKGASNEKETFLSLCVQHSSDDKITSDKSDKDEGFYRGPQKHEIHIFKERQRRAQQKKQFLKLGELIFEPNTAVNKPKIAVLKKAYEVIKAEKKKAKALDEELSAQRFCNYTLRTKIKKLLNKNPHLSNLMCNPVETPAVVENVAEKMVKDGSFSAPDGGSGSQQEKNSVFKHLLPEPTQPEPFDVAQSAQKLLGAMKMCMTRAASKKDSVCHFTIQSMLDSGNEKLPSYLRTKQHMGKPVIDFESEHYIISQKIQQERAKRWQRKKKAIMRRNSRLRIGSFINAKGSGGLVFTKGVTPSVRKRTLEKSSRSIDDGELDSVNLSADSPASSMLDAIEDNESLNNRSSDDDGDDDDDDEDSLAGSLVCIAQPEEPEDPGTSKKSSSEEGRSEKKKKSTKRDKSTKKRKRSESSSEDEDDPSPFGAFVIDESLPSEGEDGWIDDEPHPEDGWEEEEGMGDSMVKANKTGGLKTGLEKEHSVRAKTGDSEGGQAVNIDEERADPKEKDAKGINQGSKQDPADMSDINVDVRKIIPCLQVEEKDDGTLDVVLQGEFSDERLDELFARPGVMDYLRKAAAQKKKTKAKESPSGSGK